MSALFKRGVTLIRTPLASFGQLVGKVLAVAVLVGSVASVTQVLTFPRWIILLTTAFVVLHELWPRSKVWALSMFMVLLVASGAVALVDRATATTRLRTNEETHELIEQRYRGLLERMEEVNRGIAKLASSPSPPSTTDLDRARESITAWVNGLRAYDDLPPLALLTSLNGVAQNHSMSMRNAGELFNDSENNRRASVDRQLGSRWTLIGENVGSGSDWESILRAFRNSENHLANLVSPAYNRLGVGIARDLDGQGVFITLLFVRAI